MKVVILAGGRGTRLAEETSVRPKPMVEVGRHPLLWHIMQIYAHHGFKDFLVACGYKGEVIKEYFNNFFILNSDYEIDLGSGDRRVVNEAGVDWKVGVVDTGTDTMTGGRILRLRPWLEERTFMVTYGDGVADIDLKELVAWHRDHHRLATVTAVRPPARFGGLDLEGDVVRNFTEKPQAGGGWINGGFFVFEPGVFDYLEDDDSILERDPLEHMARDGELMAFRHKGFWQPMDTLRDKLNLESMWEDGAPWKVW